MRISDWSSDVCSSDLVEVGEGEFAVARADQAADLQPEMFQHLADFAVLALGQRHFDPLIAPRAAFEIGVDLAVADAVDLDPHREFFELRLADVAEGARAVRSEEHTSELQQTMRNSYAVFCLKK